MAARPYKKTYLLNSKVEISRILILELVSQDIPLLAMALTNALATLYICVYTESSFCDRWLVNGVGKKKDKKYKLYTPGWFDL